MLAWIAENAVTIIALLVLAALTGTAVLSLIREKKHKSCGCTGNCASCGMCRSCNSTTRKE